MTDADQAEIDRIEKQRREREATLLLLMLGLVSTARTHAVVASRIGADPADAAHMVITGDQGGHFIGAAPIISAARMGAYEAGFRAGARLVGQELAIPETTRHEAQGAFSEAATNYANDLADRVVLKIKGVQEQALGPKEELDGIRQAFHDLQITRTHPAHLEADVEAAVCESFGQGMGKAYDEPEAAVWGFEYRTMRDERVRLTHREMDGVIRPTDDSVWKLWTPPCGWGCRCILLPVPSSRADQETTELPDVLPDLNFVAA